MSTKQCSWCGQPHDNTGWTCSDACEDKELEAERQGRMMENQREQAEANMIDEMYMQNIECPDDIEIDKCMNCGKYKATETLTYPDQVCEKGCINPEEY